MMICGSCGMRMDGAAVLACKTRMYDIAQEGRVPVISAMGNLPIVKDLVVDMDPFWAKFKAMWPWLEPGYDRPDDGREYRISQERMNVIHKESLCINCGCCVSECNAMESDPEFLGPQALAKGMRFVGDPRDGATVERLERYNQEHGIWDCTRCYFCNERCPKGVDPRDAIAKLGAESIRLGIDRDMGAKHAKWFVRSAETTGWLREEELIPKTQGYVSAIKQLKFGASLARHGKVRPIPDPAHGEGRGRGAQPAQGRPASRTARARSGTSRASARSRGSTHGHADESLEEIYERPGAAPRPWLPEVEEEAKDVSATETPVKRVAYYKGCLASLSAKELDSSTQGARADGRPRARGARVGDVLRRGRHPRGRARLLPPPQRADPRLRRGDGLRDAHDGLQRLHAQPAPGELHAPGRRRAARAGQREPRDRGRSGVLRQRRGAALPLGDRRGRRLRAG